MKCKYCGTVKCKYCGAEHPPHQTANRQLSPTEILRWYKGELQQWWDSPYDGERGEWRDVVHYR